MSGNREFLDLLPATVFTSQLRLNAEFQQELCEFIFRVREKDGTGLSKSNVGGWHSRPLRGEL